MRFSSRQWFDSQADALPPHVDSPDGAAQVKFETTARTTTRWAAQCGPKWGSRDAENTTIPIA